MRSLPGLLPPRSETFDPTHLNDIELVTPGSRRLPDAEGGRPAGLLAQCQFAGRDRRRDQDGWAMAGSFRRQHDPDLLPNGHILVFDNLGGDPACGRSRILELDPVTQAIVWSYAGCNGDRFYSEAWGEQQLLPNGNVLVTESYGGRVPGDPRGPAQASGAGSTAIGGAQGPPRSSARRGASRRASCPSSGVARSPGRRQPGSCRLGQSSLRRLPQVELQLGQPGIRPPRPSRSSWRPCSTTWPSSSTTMRSALTSAPASRWSDDQRRAALHQPVQRHLDQALVLGVQRWWLRPGAATRGRTGWPARSVPLPPDRRTALLAQERATFRQPVEELVAAAASAAARLTSRCIGPAIADVGRIGREDHRVLRHSRSRAVGTGIKLGDRYPVEQDAAPGSDRSSASGAGKRWSPRRARPVSPRADSRALRLPRSAIGVRGIGGSPWKKPPGLAAGSGLGTAGASTSAGASSSSNRRSVAPAARTAGRRKCRCRPPNAGDDGGVEYEQDSSPADDRPRTSCPPSQSTR